MAALARSSEVVVRGSVTGWREGRTIVASGVRLFNATLEVTVESADARFPGNKAYVEVFLGTQSLDENGKPFEADDDPLLTRLWLDDVVTAVPQGARVILALVPARTQGQLAREGEEVVDLGESLPDGTTLYTARSQVFLLENADGSYDSAIADHTYFDGDGWPDPVTDPDGFATLLAELDAAS